MADNTERARIDRAAFLAETRDERIAELRLLSEDIGPMLGRDAADEIEALVAALERKDAAYDALAAELEAAEDHEHSEVREAREDGALCALCGGGAYPPWLTDDETWRRVMGDSHEQVCLPCFYARAETGDVLWIAFCADAEAAEKRVAELESELALVYRKLNQALGTHATHATQATGTRPGWT